jgi:hypothetical protein
MVHKRIAQLRRGMERQISLAAKVNGENCLSNGMESRISLFDSGKDGSLVRCFERINP